MFKINDFSDYLFLGCILIWSCGAYLFFAKTREGYILWSAIKLIGTILLGFPLSAIDWLNKKRVSNQIRKRERRSREAERSYYYSNYSSNSSTTSSISSSSINMHEGADRIFEDFKRETKRVADADAARREIDRLTREQDLYGYSSTRKYEIDDLKDKNNIW